MFARAAFLIVPLSAAAQPCAPPAEKTIVLQLPGRPGLPAGSQMKMEVPVAIAPEACLRVPDPPVDALRGAKPRKGSVLSGEEDKAK